MSTSTISSAGIGSGLDVKTIVSQLMTTEQGPMNALLQREATDNAKVSAFGAIKSALATFQEAASTLNMSSTFSSVKAVVADTSFYTATLSGTAVAGSYDIQVKALAAAQKLVSQAYADADTKVGEGTLTISVGKYSGTSFAPKDGSDPVTIKIDSSNHSLSGIRDAINAADAGVKASIIDDGSGARLSLTAADSGLANAVKIGVAETGTPGLAKLAYDGGASAGLTQNVAAADAHLLVDNVDVYKSSNVVTDAVQGITLNLLKTTDSSDKLSLSADTDKVRSAIDTFVNAYNGVHKQLDSLTAYDKTLKRGNLLTGDATAMSIDSQLRALLSGQVHGASAGLATLTDIGVGFQLDGTLAVDTDRRDKVLNNPANDVKKLFVKSSDSMVGIASIVNSTVSSMIYGDDAVLNQRVDSLKSDVTTIADKKTAEKTRLQGVEDRYTKQFSALDTLVAKMNQTQSFLTQQLAQLAANSKG